MPTTTYVATCARGLEDVLADELRDLGVAPAPARGAVRFDGALADAYRVCLWSRVASRVLRPVTRAYAGTVRALYAELRKVRWAEHLDPDRTFAVHFVGTSPEIRNSHFGALKVKDAIVDTLRDDVGRRPNVDPVTPDVRVHVHLADRRATVSIDLSGEPLHLRGHGRDGGPAPLKETLAAGVLRLAGWHQRGPAGALLVDPMCGSGTFLVEALDVLRDRAPGLDRPRWGFAGWRGHEPDTWAALVAEARRRVRPIPPGRVFGYDRDPAQVARTLANLDRAGLSGAAVVGRADLADLQPPEGRGLVVTNPPYGERLGDDDEVAATWALLGDVLRRRFLGWNAWVLAGSPALARRLGLRPRRRHVLYNGPLEGRLLQVPIAEEPVARDRVSPR